jgi:hypothetical protein
VRIFTDDKEELRSVAGVLSIKQDTNDIDVSLVHAENMERRVKEKALAAQAQLEVKAKVVHAEAAARRDAEAEVRIHNKAYLAEVSDDAMLQRARVAQMKKVEDILKGREDLNDGEKHRVAEYLSRAVGAEILDTYKALPDFAVAVGLVGSGTRDLASAAKDMKVYDKHELEWFMESQKRQEKERGLEKGPRRDKGHGLDFSR